MTLREDLQKRIDQSGISVAKLSRLTDIHSDTIFKFLRGDSEMNAAYLDKCFTAINNFRDNDTSSSDESHIT